MSWEPDGPTWEPEETDPPSWEMHDEYPRPPRREPRPLWYVLGPDGRTPVPVDDLRRVELGMQDYAKRRVAKDVVGGAEVSTVFLGLDHRMFGDGPPLLFETMIFGGECDELQRRYETWDEAEHGHARIVARLRAVEAAKARQPAKDERPTSE